MIYPANMVERGGLSYLHLGKESELRQDATPIFLAGLPGRMSTLLAEEISQKKNYALLGIAMTSNRHNGEFFTLRDKNIKLVNYIDQDVVQIPGVIAVDFTGKNADINALHYVLSETPFVMGTTGGDRDKLEALVRESTISAVIAPNMAVEVVMIQDELEKLSRTYPKKYAGWSVNIRESHQASKPDVSGTAVAFRRQLEALGATMDGEIESIRDPRAQEEMGIQNLDGHAYNWIKLNGPDGKIKEYSTSIEGRQPYIAGTLMAIDFLKEKVGEGSRGEVFTMIDVIRARRQHG